MYPNELPRMVGVICDYEIFCTFHSQPLVYALQKQGPYLFFPSMDIQYLAQCVIATVMIIANDVLATLSVLVL